MREIKFRAYIKNLGWMLPVSMIDFENETIYVSLDSDEWSNDPLEYDFDDKDIELMQYTGLKDKNGVEIYEGDIIRTAEYGTGDRVNYRGYDLFNIIFKDGAFRLDSKYRAYFLNDGFHCEIIGNIYENPELMEVSNDK